MNKKEKLSFLMRQFRKLRMQHQQKIRQKENEQQAVSLKDKVKMFTLNHTGTLRKAFAGMALLSSFSMGARGETEETSLNSIDNTKIKSLMPKNIWQNRLSFPAILIFPEPKIIFRWPSWKTSKAAVIITACISIFQKSGPKMWFMPLNPAIIRRF